MHTLFFSPGKHTQDTDCWGQSVVSLVNSKLDISIPYTYSSPNTCNEDEYTEMSPASSYTSQQSARAVSINDGEREIELSSGVNGYMSQLFHNGQLLSEDDLTTTPRFEVQSYDAICRQRRSRSLSERCLRSSDQLYRPSQSTSGLRLPDFLKRMFPPPNCLHPKMDSPERGATPDRLFYHTGHRHPLRPAFNEVIASTLNDNRHPSSSVPTRKPRAVHQSNPWCSINTRGQLLATTNIQTASQAEASDLQARNLAAKTTRMAPVCNLPRVSDTMKSTGATRTNFEHSETPGEHSQSRTLMEAIGDSRIDGARSYLSRSVLSTQATARAESRQLQIDRDIEDFLNNPPALYPLNASQITTLCETAGQLTCKPGEVHFSALRSDKPATNGPSSRRFRPRQTIGKVDRSERPPCLPLISEGHRC